MPSSNKPKSLQDIIKRRQRSEFVGRQAQINLFRQNLTLPFDDERRCFLFNVWGQGGVGKTYLIRHYRELAEKSWGITAYIDEDEKDVLSVMARMAQQFGQQGYTFKEFSERYKVFRQKRQELEADPEAPKGFSALVGRTLTKGALLMAEQVPGGSLVTGLVDKNALANQMGDLTSYVARRIGNKDEVKLVLEPIEVLTPLFLKELNQVAEERSIGLFFDTYEQTGEFLDDWLRDILEGRYGEVPPNIVMVIAGRQELDKNQWSSYEGLLARLPLEPFTQDEARDYLSRKGITNPQVVEGILRLSGRLPLLVATIAAGNPDDPARLDDPCDTAVDRFLKWVDNLKRRQVALNAAGVRRLDRDVLAELVEEEDADTFFAWLKQMPFVLERTGGWAYHDVVRLQMLRYKRRESEQGWAKLHGQLARYYETRRARLELKEEERQKNDTWQSYTLEVLYHYLCESQHKYLSIALNEFLAALKRSRSFAHSWAETIQQAGEDTVDIEVERWGKQLVEGLKAFEEKRYETTIELFSALLNKVEEVQSRGTALTWRGYLYYLLDEYTQSLSDLSEAIRLVPEEAIGWTVRGETNRRMKRYEEALTDLTRSIELKPDYEWNIASRGGIYQQMKRYEEALTDLTRAIELKPDYIWAIASRGETYRRLGHYEDALVDFNRAIALKSDYAWAIASRGETYRRLGHYENALVDFNCAIALKPDYVWAIASRGETYRQMGHYQKAVIDLTCAIELKPDYVWAIASRGETYRWMGHYREGLADFNRAIGLEPSHNWSHYSRALIYQILGQSDWAQVDLTTAIELAFSDYQTCPKNWRNTFNLALYFIASGNTQQVEQLYQEALKEAPKINIDEAIANLGDFLKLFPNSLHANAMQALLKAYQA
jgi:tetratricopeptide (TPR) repeat protein